MIDSERVYLIWNRSSQWFFALSEVCRRGMILFHSHFVNKNLHHWFTSRGYFPNLISYKDDKMIDSERVYLIWNRSTQWFFALSEVCKRGMNPFHSHFVNKNLHHWFTSCGYFLNLVSYKDDKLIGYEGVEILFVLSSSLSHINRTNSKLGIITVLGHTEKACHKMVLPGFP